jgi:hypothetical protein
VAVYSGSFLLLGVVWNLLWRHASGPHKLISEHITPEEVKAFTRNFYVGPILLHRGAPRSAREWDSEPDPDTRRGRLLCRGDEIPEAV